MFNYLLIWWCLLWSKSYVLSDRWTLDLSVPFYWLEITWEERAHASSRCEWPSVTYQMEYAGLWLIQCDYWVHYLSHDVKLPLLKFCVTASQFIYNFFLFHSHSVFDVVWSAIDWHRLFLLVVSKCDRKQFSFICFRLTFNLNTIHHTFIETVIMCVFSAISLTFFSLFLYSEKGRFCRIIYINIDA